MQKEVMAAYFVQFIILLVTKKPGIIKQTQQLQMPC